MIRPWRNRCLQSWSGTLNFKQGEGNDAWEAASQFEGEEIDALEVLPQPRLQQRPETTPNETTDGNRWQPMATDDRNELTGTILLQLIIGDVDDAIPDGLHILGLQSKSFGDEAISRYDPIYINKNDDRRHGQTESRPNQNGLTNTVQHTHLKRNGQTEAAKQKNPTETPKQNGRT